MSFGANTSQENKQGSPRWFVYIYTLLLISDGIMIAFTPYWYLSILPTALGGFFLWAEHNQAFQQKIINRRKEYSDNQLKNAIRGKPTN